MIEKNLTKLGFSPSEIKIYLHLLKTGSSYANKISSETKINRTNVYEALDRLIAKGVISFIIRNKIKWFEAKNPESVISLIKEKEEEINKTKKELFKEIKKISVNLDKKLEANIFVGRKGLRMIFEEMLEKKKPISLMGSQLQFRNFFGPYFELWHRKRIEKKISQKSIFPKQFRPEIEKFKKILKKINEKTYIEYQFVENKFINPTATFLYGDNCIFVQWSREPIAIKINNKEITKSHKNYFEMLWKS
jgi:sugar-specific transcriptional regulator TrmB